MDHKENTASIVKVCLRLRCVTMNVLLLLAFASEVCLLSRCLAMGIHVTIFSTQEVSSRQVFRLKLRIYFSFLLSATYSAHLNVLSKIMNCPIHILLRGQGLLHLANAMKFVIIQTQATYELEHKQRMWIYCLILCCWDADPLKHSREDDVDQRLSDAATIFVF
jgi:hypothetical protein